MSSQKAEPIQLHVQYHLEERGKEDLWIFYAESLEEIVAHTHKTIAVTSEYDRDIKGGLQARNTMAGPA